jgi:hypothetical protein
MDERQAIARRGAKRVAFGLVAVLLVGAVPFGWSVYREYRAFRDYARETLDEPSEPPPWKSAGYDPEACVGAGLEWLAACPGYEEFCRRAMPRVIEGCLEAADRSAWCAEHHDELLRTSFGYPECERWVEEGQLPDHRYARQRCAMAYRTAAEWCLRHRRDGA